MVGHRGCGLCQCFWASERERERERERRCKGGEKNLFSLPSTRLGEEEDV